MFKRSLSFIKNNSLHINKFGNIRYCTEVKSPHSEVTEQKAIPYRTVFEAKGEFQSYKYFIEGFQKYFMGGAITSGALMCCGFVIPSAMTAGVTSAAGCYAFYLRRNALKTIARFDYCHSTDVVRIYPTHKMSKSYIEANIENLYVKDEKENLKFFNLIRENGDDFAKNNEKEMNEFLPENNNSLSTIVDAIPHYGSEKFDSEKKNTIPIPFYIKENNGDGKQYFLAIGINNFCYIQTDLMQKIVEGKAEEAHLVIKRKNSGFGSKK